jgi:hypothetical protein
VKDIVSSFYPIPSAPSLKVSVLAAIEEKLETKRHNMLHMMAVLEQEGPAFAERAISTILGSFSDGA